MAERVTVPDMMNAREARAQAQRTLLARYPGAAVVCLCMNIAGPVKRTENIERAFAWGAAQVKAVLAPYETLFDAAIHEKTGPEAMICVRAEAKAVKKRLARWKTEKSWGGCWISTSSRRTAARFRGQISACLARALSALRQARARLREKPRAQRGRAL